LPVIARHRFSPLKSPSQKSSRRRTRFARNMFSDLRCLVSLTALPAVQASVSVVQGFTGRFLTNTYRINDVEYKPPSMDRIVDTDIKNQDVASDLRAAVPAQAEAQAAALWFGSVVQQKIGVMSG
jgi:hypothetical protein